MKLWTILIALVLCIGPVCYADNIVDISLLDGSKLKGRVMSSNGAEITVMSDLGVFRIPLEKLTEESRQAVTEASKPDLDALLRKVAELEAKVSQLQQENESLRRQMAVTPTPGYRPSGVQSLTPSPPPTSPPAAGGSFTMSSTGKRHNSGCRYFGTGRSCGPTEGIACKICGG